MATLEHIMYSRHLVSSQGGAVSYIPSRRPAIEAVPQIFWSDGSPWREANHWAIERASSKDVKLRTVNTNLTGLLCYATFLESTPGLTWFAFPARKSDRCLVRYRGWLIGERDAGRIKSSTASAYMRIAIAFYRHLTSEGLLTAGVPLWRDKVVYLRFMDESGLQRTMARVTTDLAIPNRRAPGIKLEDGLLPVSASDRDAILQFSNEEASEELYLMLSTGFFTGMRIGSISDMKVTTLETAAPDPGVPGLFKLNIGPDARPPVRTKFGVTGQAWIPESLLDALLSYAQSTRRSRRVLLASSQDRDNLFLTRFGNPYCRKNTEHSTAVNTEMSTLRKRAAKASLHALKGFHFHCSRATFATELADIAVRAGDPINAIAVVREALLHQKESTSLQYIKFVQQFPVRRDAANSFSRAFSGVADAPRKPT